MRVCPKTIRLIYLVALTAFFCCEVSTAGLNFDDLSQEIQETGIDLTLKRLKKSIKTDEDRRLYALLDSNRTVLRRHPNQLWFQLQSRGRWKGWEWLQEDLMKHRPPRMLVARTSHLPAPNTSTIRTWDLGEVADETPSPYFFAKLPSSNRLLCGLVAPNEIVSINTDSEQLTKLSSLPSVLGGMTCTSEGSLWAVCSAEMGKFYNRGSQGEGIHILDAASGELIVKLRDRGESPITMSKDGGHIIFWNGTSFTARRVTDPSDSFRFRGRAKPDVSGYLSIDFVRPDRLVAVDQNGYVRQFEFPGGKETASPKQIVNQPFHSTVSPDGSRLACCGAVNFGAPLETGPRRSVQKMETVLVIWDTQQQEIVSRFSLSNPEAESKGARVTAMSFVEPDFLVTGNQKGQIQTWKTDAAQPLTTIQAFFPEVSVHSRWKRGQKAERITMHSASISGLYCGGRTQVYAGSGSVIKLVDLSLPDEYPIRVPAETTPKQDVVGEPYNAKFVEGNVRIKSNSFVNDGIEEFEFPVQQSETMIENGEIIRDLARGSLVVGPKNGRCFSASTSGVILEWDLSKKLFVQRFDLDRPIEQIAYDGVFLTVTEQAKSGGRLHVFEYVP